MAVQSAKALGADKVILTGTRDDRLELGASLGADHIVQLQKRRRCKESKRVHQRPRSRPYTGSRWQQRSLTDRHRNHPSRVLIWFCWLTLMIRLTMLTSEQLFSEAMSIYTVRGEGSSTVKSALSLMHRGLINADPLITHHFSLDDINEAFRTFRAREANALKVIVKP
ncbi:MAG: zinc-binding dehydrogenase [Sphaerochaetaceae bacterium]